MIKQYRAGQCDPAVVMEAVKTAKIIRAGELSEALVEIIDFVYYGGGRIGGTDGPMEEFFVVVDALSQIGLPAVDPIMTLLMKENIHSLKSQLGRRTIILIYDSNCVEYLEKRVAAVDEKKRGNLELQLAELKREIPQSQPKFK